MVRRSGLSGSATAARRGVSSVSRTTKNKATVARTPRMTSGDMSLAGRKPSTGAIISHSNGPSNASETSHVGNDASQRRFASVALGCRGSMSSTSTKRRRPIDSSSSLVARRRARARVQCRGVGGSHAYVAHASKAIALRIRPFECTKFQADVTNMGPVLPCVKAVATS